MGLTLNITPGEIGAAATIFPVLGILLTAARFWARHRAEVGYGLDDWLIIPAAALLLGMGIVNLYGIAIHVEGLVIPAQPSQALYADYRIAAVFWNTEWMQPLALGCIKLSFIFFYRRIFVIRSWKQPFSLITGATAILLLAWSLAFFIAVMLICPGHVEKYWTDVVWENTKCWSRVVFLPVYCWSDAAMDILIILLPIIPILKLQMTLQRKIATVAIFGLGSLSLAASLIRAVFYQRIIQNELTGGARLDPVMSNSNALYWTLVETGLAIIAVNLPPLYSLISKSASLENAVRSVRSLTSLTSWASHASSENKKSKNARDVNSDIETVSDGAGRGDVH